jgi:AcrR family transcriptional regulator
VVPTRNQRRDPARNQERILGAATEEFSRYGLGGARVDRIAARAGANKRMLYYYYGNKEALFLAVLESRYAHIRRAEQGLRLGDLDPVEGVRRLIAFTWNYYLKHPEFLTLLNSENLHRARHLRRSRQIAAMTRRSSRRSRDCSSAARATGGSATASTRCSSTSRSLRSVIST